MENLKTLPHQEVKNLNLPSISLLVAIGFSGLVDDAIAQSRKLPPKENPSHEVVLEDVMIKRLKVEGQDYGKIHLEASKQMKAALEKTLKDPNVALKISDFNIGLGRKKGGKKVMIYRVNLEKTSKEEACRVIGFRGTIHSDPNFAEAENKKKVPSWQESMKADYDNVLFLKSDVVTYGGYTMEEVLACGQKK